MSSRRYETTGQRRPHEVATGYQHASRYDVPLERAQPFPWPAVWWIVSRSCVVALPFVVLAGAWVMLP